MATILVAGNALKGTLDCRAATRALARGVQRAGHTAVPLPIADGGDGSLMALRAVGFRQRTAIVHDAYGAKVEARFGWRASDRVAAVEFAQAAGLWRTGGVPRDPWLASSYGAGELLEAALALGPAEILMLLGGSATQDVGLGLLQALGAQAAPLLLRHGCAADLGGIRSVDLEPARRRFRGVTLCAACDVDHPLSGSRGSAASFAAQKGFRAAEIAELDAKMAAYGDVLARAAGVDVERAGAGAAGGAALAVLALGGDLVPGAERIFDLIGLAAALRAADAVITCEGHVDATTWQGKAPGAVCALALAEKKKSAVVCASFEGPAPPEVLVLAAPAGKTAREEDLARLSEAAARTLGGT